MAEACEVLALDLRSLRVENFRTDGTSNYLANLNCRGQTWAAALRFPALGATVTDFLADKERALVAVEYLLSVLSKPISVGNDVRLVFSGASSLVEGLSVQNFLREQVALAPIRLIDQVNGREGEVRGFDYPQALAAEIRDYAASYTEPFYLSRGAPAWETLEEFPSLSPEVAKALGILHRITGAGEPMPFEIAAGILQQLRKQVLEEADAWVPAPGSKEERGLAKSRAKWNKEEDSGRELLIRRERFIRSEAGRLAYKGAWRRFSSAHIGDQTLRSFSHGDPHGGNFVIVRYGYSFDGDVLVDRVFLNEVFRLAPEVKAVAIDIEAGGSTISHRLPSEDKKPTVTAIRCPRYEIHMIDLDNGQGATEGTKEVHLVDALLFALSIENLTALFDVPLEAREALRFYYEGLQR
jgi:hypothetical protein